MKTFEINRSGDWTLQVLDGDAELIQSLTHLIYERLGEWFLNEDHGFRREVVEEKGYSEKEVVQAIYDAIYQDPRVIEVIQVDYDFNRITRKLSIELRLQTERGEIDVNIGRI